MKLKTMAIGTGILLVLAVGGVVLQQQTSAPDLGEKIGKPVLGDLDITRVKKVIIEDPDGSVTVKAGEGSWVVEELAGFTADANKLNQLLIKLGEENIAHMVTQNKDKLGKLELLTKEENGGKAEKDKTGTLLDIQDEAGASLFSVIIGNDRQGATPGAYGGQYLRFPGSTAAYLIGSSLIVDSNSKYWANRKVLQLEKPALIKRVTINPPKAPPIIFSREKGEDPMVLQGAKKGVADATVIDNMLKKLADLEMEILGVGNPKELGRETTGNVVAELFDQRVFTLSVGQEKGKEDFRYFTIQASLPDAVSDATLRTEVTAFNQRFEGRFLGMYEWNISRFYQEREKFLVAKEVKKP